MLAETRGLMSTREVAERFGVHLNTVYSWIHTYQMPSIKVGATIRIPRDDFDRWVRRHYITGDSDRPVSNERADEAAQVALRV